MSLSVWRGCAAALVLVATALPAEAQVPAPAESPAPIAPLDLAFEPSVMRRADGELDRKTPRLAVDTSFTSFSIAFEREGDALSAPQRVTWSMRLNEADPVVDGWVQAVLTGPSGERWVGREERVSRRRETGPIRAVGTASLADGDATLLAAVAQGGRFRLSLEDDRGRLWGDALIVVPDAARRQALEDEERARFLALDPESVPRPAAGPPRLIMPLILPSMRQSNGVPELAVGRASELVLAIRFEADGDAVGPVTSALLDIRQGGAMAAATDAPPFVLIAPGGEQKWDGDAAWLDQPCESCTRAIYDLTRSADWPAIKAALEAGGNFQISWRVSPDRRSQLAVSSGRPASRNDLWTRARARAAALAATP